MVVVVVLVQVLGLVFPTRLVEQEVSEDLILWEVVEAAATVEVVVVVVGIMVGFKLEKSVCVCCWMSSGLSSCPAN